MGTFEDMTLKRSQKVLEIKETIKILNGLLKESAELEVGMGIEFQVLDGDDGKDNKHHLQVAQGNTLQFTSVKTYHVRRDEF